MRIQPQALSLVHPAYRRFFRHRSHRLTGALRKAVPLGLRIRNRILRYRPLPRLPPFLCNKCRFSSYSLRKVEDHVCSKKVPLANDFEQELKIAQLGYRSRYKDALAVLERLPNPQAVHLHRLHVTDFSDCQPSTSKSFDPSSLRSLAYRSLPKINSQTTFIATEALFQDPPGLSRPYPYFVTKKSPATYCKSCRQIFYSYDKYNDHLEEGLCAKVMDCDPIFIQLRADSTIPAEYEYGRRISNCTLQLSKTLQCTACGMDSYSFEKTGSFHEHLFECAKELRKKKDLRIQKNMRKNGLLKIIEN